MGKGTTVMRPSGHKRGFSLVELLIAITVLSVGLLAVASMQTVAISHNSVSHKMMAATELAKQAMEDITAWDVAHPHLNTAVTDAPYATHVWVTGGGAFDIKYSTTVDTPSPGSTRVIVTVTEAPAAPQAIGPVVITGFKRVL